MILKLLAACSLACMLMSCQNKKVTIIPGSSLTLDLETPDTSKYISQIISDVEFVRLEGKSGENFIGEISKVTYHDGRYYVLDDKFDNFYVFSEEGKFVTSIGKVGTSVGEYLNLTDFYLDTQKKVILLFSSQMKAILEYDLSGNYIRATLIDFFAYSFTKLSENYVFYVNNNRSDASGYNNLLITDSNFRVVKRLFPFSKDFRASLGMSGFLTTVNGQVLFCPPLSDSIFCIKNIDTLHLVATVSFGKKSIPEDIKSNFQKFMNKGVSYSFIGNVFVATRDHFLFSFLYDKRMILGISSASKDKPSRLLTSWKVKEDFLTYLLGSSSSINSVDDGKTLIANISPSTIFRIRKKFPYLLQNFIRTENQAKTSIITSISEVENPILMRFKINTW